jgi:hypothetical protein
MTLPAHLLDTCIIFYILLCVDNLRAPWDVSSLLRGKSVFVYYQTTVYRKKRLATFPSPAGMSLTKLTLGNNLITPAQGEFGK